MIGEGIFWLFKESYEEGERKRRMRSGGGRGRPGRLTRRN